MNAARSAYADYEVVDLLADEPELLAIADAVAATQPRPSRHRRWPRLAVLAAVVAVVVTAALALMPQRGGDQPFLTDALAAIGGGPVLHARIEARLPETHVVELASGRAAPQTISIEYWFDESSARLATVVRRGGVPIARFLATPSGTVSDAGPVRTTGPSAPALLHPALAGFVTRYREALESGAARVVDEGKLGGRDVVWLQMGAGVTRERVAVDAESFTPISLVPLARGRPTTFAWRVRTIETIARVESNFAVPLQRAQRPYRGDVRASRPLSSAQVDKVVRWPALWLGESWNGLRLSSLELQTLTRGYPPGSRQPSTRGHGLQLRYTVDSGRRAVEISQAPFPEPAYAFAGAEATFNGNPIPREGFVEIVALGSAQGSATRVVGQLRQAGVYFTIWASSRELCLAAARALTRIPK